MITSESSDLDSYVYVDASAVSSSPAERNLPLGALDEIAGRSYHQLSNAAENSDDSESDSYSNSNESDEDDSDDSVRVAVLLTSQASPD
jgi:hypothetical protein